MIFITGATGLVGANISAQLLQQGKAVKALKRSGASLNTIENTFRIYFKNEWKEFLDKIIWCEGDLTDYTLLEEHMKGCDTVYHIAALVSFHKRDFEKLISINQKGTGNIVNACLNLGVKRLLYASSVAVFPNAEEIITEELVWKESKNKSQYAITKYYAENEVWRGIEEGLNTVIINPGVILGPGQTDGNGSVFFNLIKNGLKFYTPGSTGFVDVRDVAKTAILLSESSLKSERYIVVGENAAYKTVFETIAGFYNKPIPTIKTTKSMLQLAAGFERLKSYFTKQPPQINDTTIKASFEQIIYSNQKIKAALGFEFIPLAETLKYCCEHY